MEKYNNYNIIKNHDIQNFRGLDTEVITHFYNPQGKTRPLWISCYGITYPTPYYYIKRYPVRGFILEHIVSGKGYLIVNGEKHTLIEGDTYLLKSGENVEYFSDEQTPYQKLWVNFSGELPRQIISLYKLRDTVYKNVNLSPLFENLHSLDKISNDFDLIFPSAVTTITNMLMLLAKSIEKEEFYSEIAVKIKKELNLAVNKPYSLDEVSEKLFLSKSEIIRYFKNAFKITPYQYLLDQKINYAKTMLENGNSSVKEISEHLGFSSPYHFSDTFKLRVGCSPIQYRKQIRG